VELNNLTPESIFAGIIKTTRFRFSETCQRSAFCPRRPHTSFSGALATAFSALLAIGVAAIYKELSWIQKPALLIAVAEPD